MVHLIFSILAAVLTSPISGQTTDQVSFATDFAVSLYKNIAKTIQSGSNVAVSPFSAEAALALAFAGAAGQTRSEIASILRFSPKTSDKNVAQSIKSVSGSSGGNTLQVANGAFVEQSFEILAGFRNKVSNDFGANISAVDFKNQADAARNQIDAFVEANTNNKIHDLLAEGSLDSSTKLVLVNAIYFKADWQTKFEAESTNDQSFFLLDGTSKTARMMANTDLFGYSESTGLGGAQLLEMAYNGGAASLIVILPKKETGLKGLEDVLTAAALDASLGSLATMLVKVSLPKFKVNSGCELTDTLKTMGMTNAFSDSADFSGISTKRNLTISSVVQKVFVGVDEQGTEAAAATAAVLSAAQSEETVEFSSPPKVFRADRPFLYLIRHNPTKAFLFMGRVADPTVEQ